MPTSPGYIRGPLVIPNCVEVKLGWTLQTGRKGSNVLHASNPASVPISSTLADTISNGINADARTGLFAVLVNQNVSFTGVSLRNLDTARLAEFPNTVGGFVGGSVADALPAEVALVISLKSAVSGPRGRGRVYVPGWTTNSLGPEGQIIPTDATIARDFIQAVSDAIFANGMALCIANRAHDAYISPFTGIEVPAEAAGTEDVLSIVVADDVFDSQRRRKG